MKKLLLLISFFSIAESMIAQPTYTITFNLPGHVMVSIYGHSFTESKSYGGYIEGSSEEIVFQTIGDVNWLHDNEKYQITAIELNGKDIIPECQDKSGIYPGTKYKYYAKKISSDLIFNIVVKLRNTYSLNIVSTGNGSVSYGWDEIRNKTLSYTLYEGTSATIAISPDKGYKIKSVKENNTDVTLYVSDNAYTINSIRSNTNIEVEFEAIVYTLSISSTGGGVTEYNSTEVRGTTMAFTVNNGSSATILFIPDDGNRLNSIIVNGTDVTSQVTSNRYTISDIRANTTLAATFVGDITVVTVEGVNYKVVSQSNKTINLAGGDYGQVLTVPTSVSSNEKTWKVVGVEQDALKDNTDLAAIIWNPEIEFNGVVSNPNLLLYVKNKQYAPNTIKNVVVNGEAEEITLVDAQSGNNFYCPQAFTAKKVSYEHHYGMTTGYNTCQGWETIVLPFDVATILNATAQEIVPYAIWDESSSLRTFWLYNLTASGWQAANSIKANTPYIISMPNNENYDASYNITGNIQFIGNNVQIKASDNLSAVQSGNKSFVPNYQYQETSSSIYALNVNNQWNTNTSPEAEGSTFIRSLRAVRPFEAYLTVEGGTSAPNYIPVFGDGMPTGIDAKLMNSEGVNSEKWYSLDGRKLQGKPTTKGLYIVNGRKVVVK